MTDWSAWHDDYRDPDSPLSQRLRVVQGHISDWLDGTAPRPVTAVSMCAGDGRDLLEVLGQRLDATRLTATLVEWDLLVWTRHRRQPDRTPQIRDWLAEAGYQELSFTAPDNRVFSVGAHRYMGDPVPLRAGEQLFTFLR